MRIRRAGEPGDPVAVLQRIYPPLRATAASLVGPQDAADLVQEALVRVLARYPEFAGLEHPLGYSKAVLLHLAYRSWARPEVPANVLALLDRPARPEFSDALMAAQCARDALRGLPPRQRACVYLKVIEDMDDAQVAAVLGCAESTVRSQLARGLAALARSMRAGEVADVRRAAAWVLAASALAAAGCSSGSSGGPRHPGGLIVFVHAGFRRSAFVPNTDLVAVSPTGRLVSDMTPDTAAEANPSWSKDGGVVAFTRSTEQNTGAVFTMRADGSQLHLIANCFSSCGQTGVAISPNGRLIAYTVPGVQQFDSIVIETVSGDDRHTICTHDRCGQGLGAIAWSPGSTRIAFTNQDLVSLGFGPLPSEIRVAAASGGGVSLLTGAACRAPAYACSYDTDPTWSPDGREIAYSHWALYRPHLSRPVRGMWLVPASGGRPHQLFSCPALSCPQQAEPVWSPNGRDLAFASNLQGSAIELVPLHGRPRTIRACVRAHCVVPTGVVWSPDGRSLAFTGSTYPTASVYTIRTSGGGLRRIAQGAISAIAWLSGDGIPARPPPRT